MMIRVGQIGLVEFIIGGSFYGTKVFTDLLMCRAPAACLHLSSDGIGGGGRLERNAGQITNGDCRCSADFIGDFDCRLRHGDSAGRRKRIHGRMFKLVLGVTLVGNIAWLFFDKDASLFGYYIQSFQSMANANYPAPLNIDLSDQAQGINFVGLFVTYFERICLYGAAQLMPIAFKLLMALAVIDITIELMFKLEGDHIQYILHEIFKVGFFIFLIGNWITGTNLMNQLFVSFEQIGITASGVNTIVATSVGEEQIVPQSVLLVAFKVVNAMYAHAPEWKFNIIAQLVQVVVMLASFILICLMAVKIVILRMTFWLVAMITVPLIPFGAFKHTRFIFERVIGAMFNLGIRNAVLTFLMCIIGPILQGLSLKFANSSGFMDNIVSLLLLLFACILLYALVLAADGMAAGLLSGNPNLSSGDLVQTARSAGRKVTGTVDTAAAAAGVIQSARTMQGGDATTGGSKMGTVKNLGSMGQEYMKQNAPVVSSVICALSARTYSEVWRSLPNGDDAIR